MAPPRAQVGRVARAGRVTPHAVEYHGCGAGSGGSGGTNNSLDAPSGAILVASDEAERLISRVESIRVEVCATCDRLLGPAPEPETGRDVGPAVTGVGQVGALATLLQRLEEEVHALTEEVARLRAL